MKGTFSQLISKDMKTVTIFLIFVDATPDEHTSISTSKIIYQSFLICNIYVPPALYPSTVSVTRFLVIDNLSNVLSLLRGTIILLILSLLQLITVSQFSNLVNTYNINICRTCCWDSSPYNALDFIVPYYVMVFMHTPCI